jgi:hypothetical protein
MTGPQLSIETQVERVCMPSGHFLLLLGRDRRSARYIDGLVLPKTPIMSRYALGARVDLALGAKHSVFGACRVRFVVTLSSILSSSTAWLLPCTPVNRASSGEPLRGHEVPTTTQCVSLAR